MFVRNKCCTRRQTGQHLCRQHCVRNNVSSFARAFKLPKYYSNLLKHFHQIRIHLFKQKSWCSLIFRASLSVKQTKARSSLIEVKKLIKAFKISAIELTVTCDNALLLVSLTQLVSSRPKDSSGRQTRWASRLKSRSLTKYDSNLD